jgi:hypothetical protein
MGYEGSLLYSQELNTGPCPEQDKFGPHPHILSPQNSVLNENLNKKIYYPL